ncbi:MAG: CAP domain-containing protein [Cytophagaceae bacterium]|nr:CAP domain-containing protein [Cytophagaceae bacterium]
MLHSLFKRNYSLLLASTLLFMLTAGFSYKPAAMQEDPEICLSKEEQRMYDLIMAYRQQKKLPAIKISAALTKVAQIHARDLSMNKPNNADKCNMHSWSSKGNWTPCCYDSKHTQSQCMWSKPKEIAGFQADGFEIVSGSMDDNYIATSDAALAGWKKSPGHHAVIVNSGIWKQRTWQAIGIGVYKNYICVWVASVEDKNTVQKKCD